MICRVLAIKILQGVWKQHLRPRAVVGYGVKIILPSPSNYVTRSPGMNRKNSRAKATFGVPVASRSQHPFQIPGLFCVILCYLKSVLYFQFESDTSSGCILLLYSVILSRSIERLVLFWSVLRRFIWSLFLRSLSFW